MEPDNIKAAIIYIWIFVVMKTISLACDVTSAGPAFVHVKSSILYIP